MTEDKADFSSRQEKIRQKFNEAISNRKEFWEEGNSPVAVFGRDGNLTFANRVAQSWFEELGIDYDPENPKKITDLTKGKTDLGLALIEKVIGCAKKFNERVIPDKELPYIMIEGEDGVRTFRLRPSFLGGEEKLGIVMNGEDISNELIDHLTGLPNRKFAEIELERFLSGERRRGMKEGKEGEESWLTLLALDLSNFKAINDAVSWAEGDKSLQEFAERVSQKLRRDEVFARVGGDEFLIIIKDGEEAVGRIEEEVKEVTEAIKRIAKKSAEIRGRTIEEGEEISLGVRFAEIAITSENIEEDPSDLIEKVVSQIEKDGERGS